MGVRMKVGDRKCPRECSTVEVSKSGVWCRAEYHMTAHSPEEELHLVDCSAGRTPMRAVESLNADVCLPWRHSALDRPAIYMVLMSSPVSLMVASGKRWYASLTSRPTAD